MKNAVYTQIVSAADANRNAICADAADVPDGGPASKMKKADEGEAEDDRDERPTAGSAQNSPDTPRSDRGATVESHSPHASPSDCSGRAVTSRDIACAPQGADHVPIAASETPDSSIAYRRRVDDLIAALGTDARQGITDEDARSRLERHGHNE